VNTKGKITKLRKMRMKSQSHCKVGARTQILHFIVCHYAGIEV